MNINYPNTFDQMNGRSGSSILIHGGCGSIGCFAIQNENVEEVYGAVRAALRYGQSYVPVLALPFRYSAMAPEREDTLHMSEFWTDLRRADLLFERDKLPPAAWICDGRYYFADRRGDRRRHAVHLPGCRPLDNSTGMRDAKNRPEPEKPVVDASAEETQKADGARQAVESLQKAVENEPQAGKRKSMPAGLTHAALKAPAACPRKYPRCRFFVRGGAEAGAIREQEKQRSPREAPPRPGRQVQAAIAPDSFAIRWPSSRITPPAFPG